MIGQRFKLNQYTMEPQLYVTENITCLFELAFLFQSESRYCVCLVLEVVGKSRPHVTQKVIPHLAL